MLLARARPMFAKREISTNRTKKDLENRKFCFRVESKPDGGRAPNIIKGKREKIYTDFREPNTPKKSINKNRLKTKDTTQTRQTTRAQKNA